jgi:biopolymer transport protein ExbD
MFFLMLFFLIASTLANPNVIKIMLPKAKTTSTVQTKPFVLTVKFDEQDVNHEQILYYIDQEKTPVGIKELEARLIKSRDAFSDPENPDNRLNVVLRLDRKLTVQEMVDVMEIGANLGIRMVLATDKSRK